MTVLLSVAVLFLVWKLWQTQKSKQIVMNRYIDATNPQHLMYTPDGKIHPTWCPNCGRNL